MLSCIEEFSCWQIWMFSLLRHSPGPDSTAQLTELEPKPVTDRCLNTQE